MLNRKCDFDFFVIIVNKYFVYKAKRSSVLVRLHGKSIPTLHEEKQARTIGMGRRNQFV